MNDRTEQMSLLKDPRVDQTEDSFYIVDIIEKRNIKWFVEIGTSLGGSALFYSYSLPSDCTIVLIDESCRINSDFEQQIKMNCPRLYKISGSSHSQEVYDKLVNMLQNKSIDFLHIDGDHSYEGVKADFHDYYNLVSKGGLIALHDIHAIPEVVKFWNELKKSNKYRTEEIPESFNRRIYANIGIVHKD